MPEPSYAETAVTLFGLTLLAVGTLAMFVRFLVRRRASLTSAGRQLVALGEALDLVAESAQQEAKFGVELERVGHHLERARDARALEGDLVHAGAFLIGTFHAELVFDLLGPGVCHLARGGMAEMVLAVDVDVGHGFTPSARAGALHGTGPPIG